MQVIETLTPEEAVVRLRALGMRISPDTIRQGIRQGVYPFGVFVNTGEKRPVYQIYRKLFEKWIDERAVLIND